MSDLISRIALLNEFRSGFIDRNYVGFKEMKVLDMIKDAPAVDAVPVVHCKECNHWKRNMHVNKEHGLCRKLSSLSITMHEYDFCSKGEPKDDG